MMGRDRQTLADAVLVSAGGMEGIFDMSRKNDVAISDDINGINLEDVSVADNRARDYIHSSGHYPATEAVLSQEEEFVTGPQGELITATNNETIEL